MTGFEFMKSKIVLMILTGEGFEIECLNDRIRLGIEFGTIDWVFVSDETITVSCIQRDLHADRAWLELTRGVNKDFSFSQSFVANIATHESYLLLIIG